MGHLERHRTGHQLYIDVTPPVQMILLVEKRRIVYICVVQFNLCRSPWAKLEIWLWGGLAFLVSSVLLYWVVVPSILRL